MRYLMRKAGKRMMRSRMLPRRLAIPATETAEKPVRAMTAREPETAKRETANPEAKAAGAMNPAVIMTRGATGP